ncbi:MAG: glutamine-hydrolyzing GMP synthase [Candidatus Levybacteria bacterium]|nr:glutamine-hydrolyzing GMP synthase [Candidatus Levybacteria bacterium]
MILVIDFGSQTSHLINRRLSELGVKSLLINPQDAILSIVKHKPKGIILSGGPSSVYEKNALIIDKKIFSYNIPILGICYGLQLIVHNLMGKVISGKKEYGPAVLNILDIGNLLSKGLPKNITVWMSHGDEIISLPKGFLVLGATETMPFAFIADVKKKLYGVQFHPEVEHTEYGDKILENFANVCEISRNYEAIDIDALIKNIKDKVGDSYVVGAVSGGVDSTVAGVLTARAIGKQFIPVYVDNGLMRDGTTEFVEKIFTHIGHTSPIVLKVGDSMLKRLEGVSDSEQKRKIIGKYYIDLFEQEMDKLIFLNNPVKFLLQGTIYSDVIESGNPKDSTQSLSSDGYSASNATKIKSHHNVGGLPENMKLKLLEPLRHFYKDEVRQIGKLLGLPDNFINKQTFPGPGYAIRIRGEVTKSRLDKVRQADTIVLEELERANLLDKIYMSFAIMTGAMSTAVKGDGRFFGEIIALRVVESKDVMTSTWARIPYDILQKISSRIVNEVPEISRVVYDITTKPPATMEWE